MWDDKKVAIIAIVYSVIFLGVGIVCAASGYDIGGAMLVGLLTALGIAFVHYLIGLPKRNKKKDIEKNILFYNICIARGVQSFDSPKDIKRMEMIADELGCYDIEDYGAYFEKGKQLKQELRAKKEEQERQELLDKKRKKEEKEYEKLTRYADCTGNQKTIQILTGQLEKANTELDQLSNFGSNMSSALIQKEKDWATLGGIASGLAGGAAGVATAIKVQEENAQIRERNNQTRQAIIQTEAMINQSGVKDTLRDKVGDLMQELYSEKNKLVADIPGQKLLDYLEIKHNVQISETGAFYVSAYINMAAPVIIFDDLPARIDGTLVAIVSQNGKTIGEVKMVLPFRGIRPGKPMEKPVKGICLGGAAQGTTCTVSFNGQNLYAIED